jgi:peptidoglycan/xylan/chitin deacetylase (PgdA/CDA1 family)
LNNGFNVLDLEANPMRPLVGTIRRVKRWGFAAPFSLIQRCLLFSSPPALPSKHVKIDDEERQSGSDQESSFSTAHHRLAHLVRMLVLTLLVVLTLLILLAYIIYKPPTAIISLLQWKYPNVLFHVAVPPSSRTVALSLDDAPSAETAQMLDLLRAYGAKATFFIIGSQAASHPGLVQRIHDEGHELGNHAWYDEPSFQLPLAELERQVSEVGALLPPNPGGARYFRPGSGFFTKELVDTVARLGYSVILGSIYPHDPQIHSARLNAAHVLSMVRPGGIIIMHDRRPYSAEQLELVLKGLKAGDWNVESVGGLLREAERGRGVRGEKGE